MIVGYARVSTSDQNLALQLEALKGAGCERTFTDQASGAVRNRPGLTQALEQLREGDVLCVWKLDRLGRSIRQLIELVEDLAARGVGFQSVTDGIDTNTTAGRFLLHVLAAMSEMERSLIRERTRAGLDAARSRGAKLGRKPAMTQRVKLRAKRLLSAGMSPKEVAASVGVSVPTLYRHLPASERDQ